MNKKEIDKLLSKYYVAHKEMYNFVPDMEGEAVLIDFLKWSVPRHLIPRAADVFKRGENCLDNCTALHSIHCPHAPRRR